MPTRGALLASLLTAVLVQGCLAAGERSLSSEGPAGTSAGRSGAQDGGQPLIAGLAAVRATLPWAATLLAAACGAWLLTKWPHSLRAEQPAKQGKQQPLPLQQQGPDLPLPSQQQQQQQQPQQQKPQQQQPPPQQQKEKPRQQQRPLPPKQPKLSPGGCTANCKTTSKSQSPGGLRCSADGVILSPFHDASNLAPFPDIEPAVSSGPLWRVASSPTVACRSPAALRSISLQPPTYPGADGSQRLSAVRERGTPSLAALLSAASPGTPLCSLEPLEGLSTAASKSQSSSLPVSGSSSGGSSGGRSGGSSADEAVAQLAAAIAGPVPPEQPLSADVLPARLRELLIDPSLVEVMDGPQGMLGHGASAYVVRARYQGELVAAKIFDLSASQELQESFLTECSRLAQLRHPHIITMLGMAVMGTTGLLLMELAEGHDLFSALQLTARGGGAGAGRLFGWWRRGARVALEIARAINHCHHKGFVHGDIKSSNILLTATGSAKLADIAFSRRYQPRASRAIELESFIFEPPALSGTFAWMAPEMLLGAASTPGTDIYSFGVLMHEIITGEPPLRGRMRMPRVPEECPQTVSDLMMRCLSVDPSQRPTAMELLQELGNLKRSGSLDASRGSVGWAAAPGDMLRRRASLNVPS